MLLEKLGRGIVLREVVALFYSFVYLFMPLMGYLYYTENNDRARAFVRYMPIPKDTYFDLALPAVTVFILVLCWPLHKDRSDEGESIQRTIAHARRQLVNNQKMGVVLVGLGVVISFIIQFMPSSLQYVFTLFYFASFAGLMYVYFSRDFPLRKTIMLLFGLFVVFGALRNGMFTIIAYMGMTLFSFFFINRPVALWKKVIFFTIGVFCLIIIQTVKPEYRRTVLKTNKQEKASEFWNLAMKRMDNLDNLVTPEFMWPIYYRTNQGFYVALVQRYMPASRPYDNGANLTVVILSAFVPRFLWEDKPMAGGEANMKYYTGYTIKGYTTNVGPLGEGYGSFGDMGAMYYMALLAFFVRFMYRKVFDYAEKAPLVIFWIPVMFYQVTYSGENDTLQIVNSLIKAVVFMYILYKASPMLFTPKLRPYEEPIA